MGDYLKLFEEHTDYETYIEGQDVVLPNVSYCEDNNEVHYNPIEPPLPNIAFKRSNGSGQTFVVNNSGQAIVPNNGYGIIIQGNGTYYSGSDPDSMIPSDWGRFTPETSNWQGNTNFSFTIGNTEYVCINGSMTPAITEDY